MFAGQAALVMCLCVYLAWWTACFRPSGSASGALSAVAVALAALLGAVGVALCAVRAAELPGTGPAPWLFVVGGAAALAACYALTAVAFRRRPTAELPLIVAWATLELACVSRLGGAGFTSPAQTLGLMLGALALFALSMVCYVRYYRLSGWASTVVGMIPLAGGTLYRVVLCVLLAPAA